MRKFFYVFIILSMVLTKTVYAEMRDPTRPTKMQNVVLNANPHTRSENRLTIFNGQSIKKLSKYQA